MPITTSPRKFFLHVAVLSAMQSTAASSIFRSETFNKRIRPVVSSTQSQKNIISDISPRVAHAVGTCTLHVRGGGGAGWKILTTEKKFSSTNETDQSSGLEQTTRQDSVKPKKKSDLSETLSPYEYHASKSFSQEKNETKGFSTGIYGAQEEKDKEQEQQFKPSSSQQPAFVVKLDIVELLMKLASLFWLASRTAGSGGLGLGVGRGGLRGWLGSALSGESTPYIARPVQHYTFEILNERHRRDHAAMDAALVVCEQADLSSTLSAEHGLNRRQRKRRRRIQRALYRSSFLKGASRAFSDKPVMEYKGAVGGQSGQRKSMLGGKIDTIAQALTETPPRRTIIVMDVKTSSDGHPTGRCMEQLRDSVTFLLSVWHEQNRRNKAAMTTAGRKMKKKHDLALENGLMTGPLEVVIRLESPGGAVEDFGLAANQLQRLRDAKPISSDPIHNDESPQIIPATDESTPQVQEHSSHSNENDQNDSNQGITLTICVDKVAASGGYMMACQASPNHLFAAPFATIGSIGVVASMFNVKSVLERFGIKPLVYRAGKYKSAATMFGEVTKEDGIVTQRKVNEVHEAFRTHVAEARPHLGGDTIEGTTMASRKKQLDVISTGEVWLGADALDMGLVDKIITSDEYIMQRIMAGDRVLRLKKYERLSKLPFGSLGFPGPLLGRLFHGSKNLFSDRNIGNFKFEGEDVPGAFVSLAWTAIALMGVRNVKHIWSILGFTSTIPGRTVVDGAVALVTGLVNAALQRSK